jgi:hypothetical protein
VSAVGPPDKEKLIGCRNPFESILYPSGFFPMSPPYDVPRSKSLFLQLWACVCVSF